MDLIHLDLEGERHVVADKFEELVIHEMLNVAARSTETIVGTNNGGAAHEGVARTGAFAGNQHRRSRVRAVRDASDEFPGLYKGSKGCI
jgi:hypothetical protein